MKAPDGLAKKKLDMFSGRETPTVHDVIKPINVGQEDKPSYKIVVHAEPDAEMAEQGTPYFWCILKWGNQGWHNVACNWARTRLEGFLQAETKYELLIKEEQKNKQGDYGAAT
jgi:hypothetical protein